MRKVQINFYLDFFAYAVFVLLVATGLLMEYVLVPGSRGGQGLAALGYTRHDWGGIHFYLSLAFIAAIALHVFLHWSWILATFSRYLIAKHIAAVTVTGVVSLLIIAAPFMLPLSRSTEKGELQEREGRFGRSQTPSGQIEHTAQEVESAVTVKGYMTLEEVAQQNQVPLEKIYLQLNLPPDFPANDRIGPNLRALGLDMDVLRQAVGEIKGVMVEAH